MDYPQDFPAESRAKVEVAKIRAGRQFDSNRAKTRWRSEIEALFWSYVLTPFLVFAKESSRLGLWPADETDRQCQEFLRRLTIDAYYTKGKAAGLPEQISHLDGGIRWEAQQQIAKTPEWRKYENIRLKFAASQAEPSRAQNSATSAQSVESKSTNTGNTREAYLRPILKTKGLSVRAWARKADVDFHTADNYLKGKTGPNPDTRKQLADALGVEVEDLPA